MRIQKLHIKNFRYIRSLEICDIENALILVGKNNVVFHFRLDTHTILSRSSI